MLNLEEGIIIRLDKKAITVWLNLFYSVPTYSKTFVVCFLGRFRLKLNLYVVIFLSTYVLVPGFYSICSLERLSLLKRLA